jgi:putative transposase
MGKGGPKQVKRQRHTPEQIIRKLRVAEQMLSEGKTAAEAAKALEVSEQTLHRWRNVERAGSPARTAPRSATAHRSLQRIKLYELACESSPPTTPAGATDEPTATC